MNLKLILILGTLASVAMSGNILVILDNAQL